MVTFLLFLFAVLAGYLALKLRQLIKIADHMELMESRGENEQNIEQYRDRELKKWVPYLLRPLILE